MTFVTPLFFWLGLGLVSIPVVLHLVMRRRPRRIEFPPLLLISRQFQTNTRRLRLRHLLLLLLRALILFLLGLAVARPTVKWSGLASSEAPVAAALVFDTSPRMQYRHENRTRVQAAQEMGTWLLRQLPRESEIAVFDSQTAPRTFAVDRGAARHQIERLPPASRPQTLPAVIRQAAALLQTSDRQRREIYVFTDLSENAWPEEELARIEPAVAELGDVGVYLIDVGVEQTNNAAVADVRLAEETITTSTPLRVEAEVTAEGEPRSRTVSLYVSRSPQPQEGIAADDIRYEKRAEETVIIGDGESLTLSFAVGGLEQGLHFGRVQIGEGDALDCDNRRYFAVEVRPPWPVLIVAPDPPEYHAVYVDQALAPEILRRTGMARFDTTVISYAQLAAEPLDNYAAVLLLDPRPLDTQLWERLAEYAAQGRGLALALGRRASDIDAMNRRGPQRILPGKLLVQARSGDGQFTLAPQEYAHPALRAFRSVAGTVPWDAFPVYRYWVLDELDGSANVLIPFGDGRPAMIERSLGQGRIVVWTTPLSDRPDQSPWNLLPVGEAWPFFILINETTAYLAEGAGRRLNYEVGETVILELSPLEQFATYVLQVPPSPFEDSGQSSSDLQLTPDRERDRLVITATDVPGCYRVRAGGREGGYSQGFCANFPADISRMQRVAAEEIEQRLGTDRTRLVRDQKRLIREVTAGRAGTDLVPWVVVLLVILFAGEWLLANRFYRQPQAEEEP